jgi:hypothetical protein
MNLSSEPRWLRRRQLLVSGLSLLGSVLTLGSVSLLSGCGDDKSQGQLENVPDPAVAGKDSMDFYKSQHLDAKGKAKK